MVESVKGASTLEHTMYRDKALFHLISTGVIGGKYTNRWRISRKHPEGYIMRQPVVVTVYNRYRGGVDSATKFHHSLHIYRRDQKWTMRVFRGLLGLSVLNTRIIWELHSGQKCDKTRQFVLNLAKELAQM